MCYLIEPALVIWYYLYLSLSLDVEDFLGSTMVYLAGMRSQVRLFSRNDVQPENS